MHLLKRMFTHSSIRVNLFYYFPIKTSAIDQSFFLLNSVRGSSLVAPFKRNLKNENLIKDVQNLLACINKWSHLLKETNERIVYIWKMLFHFG